MVNYKLIGYVFLIFLFIAGFPLAYVNQTYVLYEENQNLIVNSYKSYQIDIFESGTTLRVNLDLEYSYLLTYIALLDSTDYLRYLSGFYDLDELNPLFLSTYNVQNSFTIKFDNSATFYVIVENASLDDNIIDIKIDFIKLHLVRLYFGLIIGYLGVAGMIVGFVLIYLNIPKETKRNILQSLKNGFETLGNKSFKYLKKIRVNTIIAILMILSGIIFLTFVILTILAFNVWLLDLESLLLLIVAIVSGLFYIGFTVVWISLRKRVKKKINEKIIL